eukprot:TRINITY_DN7932_c0_g2_i1.p1 TRINITY_DN7932_c0_g2~~TRINITY_DN7932_c0_g2_i1.p1  ORF type:complete len:329 (-),score=76.54 TRINITY_DN7932_c0_g2_i1:446-1432(-)
MLTIDLFMCFLVRTVTVPNNIQRKGDFLFFFNITVVSSYKVLRCQLPKENPYSSAVTTEDGIENIPIVPPRVCWFCGFHGQSLCSGCKKVSYCCRQHQVDDWEAHKKDCKRFSTLPPDSMEYLDSMFRNTKLLQKKRYPMFLEYDLATDDADCHTQHNPPENSEFGGEEIEEDSSVEEVVDCTKIAEQNKLLVQQYKEKAWGVVGDEDFQLNEIVKDKFLENFHQVIKAQPDQVLRYYESTELEPLWMQAKNRLSPEKVPRCERCGGERYCEFQILPQLLDFLKIEDYPVPIDWCTLVIYSCKASCDIGETYATEFLWQQLPDNTIAL